MPKSAPISAPKSALKSAPILLGNLPGDAVGGGFADMIEENLPLNKLFSPLKEAGGRF